MVKDINTGEGKKKYTQEIKSKENVLRLQEKAQQLNEAKTQASTKREETISAAKRLALAKKADKTELSKLINKGLFAVSSPVCSNKKLTLNDVEDINLGGAIVGVLVYYVPNFNFEHPIVVLISRGIALFLKVKQICGGIESKLFKKRESEKETEAGGKAKGYGKNEQDKELDYIEAGKVIGGLIEDTMEGKKK